ncbi:PadR family transcriptional regulator [Furfurilactobacillus siliginis]|nr:PadR family transcriptional regulator [Furfurilactobacillus siliginis]GEK28392.1 transcriptional regulator [Furfurilactobacillus siliginis]
MSIQVSTELLDGMVLALLKEEDRYGYALTQEIQKSITVSESTMYPVLRRLKKEAWLTTYDQPFQGRNRRYYQITDTGKKRLTVILHEWGAYKDSLDRIFAPKTPAETKGESK